MCIIVSKIKGVALPSEQTLKNCFESNKDGAGYMIARNGIVEIKKGFMTFKDFYKSLKNEGNLTDYSVVMHFRITTQGGVKPYLCHPYPLSRNLKDLKELSFKSQIGIAHNGIISLTSESHSYYYGSYKNYKEPDYNDTMKFITDYLSLIIKDKTFCENKDTLKLIERLCGSKLAILDNDGNITYIGDFIKSEGIMYSNSSYAGSKKTKSTTKKSAKSDVNSGNYSFYDYGLTEYDIDEYYHTFDNHCYDTKTKQFSFDDVGVCPYDLGDDSYCQDCDGIYCGMCDNIRQVFKDEYDKPKYVTFGNHTVEIDWSSYDERYECAFGYDDAMNWYEIEFDGDDYQEYTITLLH